MKVFIDRCKDYERVHQFIENAFSALGGVDELIDDGDTILLKPNLLKGAPPEDAVVTHPDFVKAVVRVLEKKDVEMIIGDSPAGPMSERRLKKFYEKSDWLRVEEETSAILNYDTGKLTKKNPEGRTKRSFEVIQLTDQVDTIINLPKLKTHSLTVFTGGVKNLYGLIHGLTKAAYHGQFNKLSDFGEVLVGISEAVETKITIMDGILGMEGRGPSGGKPIKLESILASKSPMAVDYAACKLAGIPVQKVPTLSQKYLDFESIDYVKRKPSSFDENIDYPPGGSTPYRVPDFLASFLSNIYLDRPELEKERCIKCWACEEICPKNAIKEKKYGPRISWLKCIRCYCCIENCPEEALYADN